MTSARKERIARNESAFRDLNEKLEANVHRGKTEPEYAGFVCECGHAECDTTVRVDLDTFETIRKDQQLFFVVRGHEIPDAEDVVDDRDGYLVVRKHQDVAEIVEGPDRRADVGG
jgi:hypothetical protein